MIHTRLYRNGVVHGEGFPIAEVSERLSDPSVIV
jgi:magnesium transporter